MTKIAWGPLTVRLTVHTVQYKSSFRNNHKHNKRQVKLAKKEKYKIIKRLR